MSSTPSASVPFVPVFGEVFLRLKPHMARLDALLHEQILVFEPEIREMANYCIDTSGKRIRPALVFLSGCGDDLSVGDPLVRAAAVVEMIHLATLVHDDIMDGADLRRGRKTATRAYGSAAAVLLGDAIFAHALHLASQFPTTEVCLAVSESTRRVCSGEIVQTLRRGTTAVSLEDYYRVIDLKTAELFRVSCQLGSSLAGHSAGRVSATADFGRHLGIAYQIYDDLADFFGDEARIGKTLGTDLASGKLTLPLFTLLDRLDAAGRAELLEEILGRRQPDICRRLREMREHGVFDAVSTAIDGELALAEATLQPWKDTRSSSLLLELCQVLRTQVAALRPRSA
jgi:octaprenyl-diphosphate synthase